MPAVAGGSPQSAIQAVTVRLTRLQILALDTVPVTLVAAVAGRIIVPFAFVGRMHYGTTTYFQAGNPRIFLSATDYASSGWGANLAGNSIFVATLNTAAYYQPSTNFPSMLSDVSETLTSISGVPLRLDQNDVVTTGDGTVDITTFYALVNPT